MRRYRFIYSFLSKTLLAVRWGFICSMICLVGLPSRSSHFIGVALWNHILRHMNTMSCYRHTGLQQQQWEQAAILLYINKVSVIINSITEHISIITSNANHAMKYAWNTKILVYQPVWCPALNCAEWIKTFEIQTFIIQWLQVSSVVSGDINLGRINSDKIGSSWSRQNRKMGTKCCWIFLTTGIT